MCQIQSSYSAGYPLCRTGWRRPEGWSGPQRWGRICWLRTCPRGHRGRRKQSRSPQRPVRRGKRNSGQCCRPQWLQDGLWRGFWRHLRHLHCWFPSDWWWHCPPLLWKCGALDYQAVALQWVSRSRQMRNRSRWIRYSILHSCRDRRQDLQAPGILCRKPPFPKMGVSVWRSVWQFFCRRGCWKQVSAFSMWIRVLSQD